MDVEAYAAARKMFNDVRGAKALLPELLEEYNGHFMLHKAVGEFIGNVNMSDKQDALIANLEKHEGILADIEAQYCTLIEAYNDANNVLSVLADHGDVLVLRLYYLQGLSEREIPNHNVYGERLWNYSPDYVHEKKEIALTNAGYAMRDLSLVLKYS